MGGENVMVREGTVYDHNSKLVEYQHFDRSPDALGCD